MTTSTFFSSNALFLPDFLGPSAFKIGSSSLFFNRIHFDIPIFIQQEVITHFNEIGLASKTSNTLLETTLGITANFFRDLQKNANQTIEQLKPLFESKYFSGVGTIHFITRGGRKLLLNNTKEIFEFIKPKLVNTAMLHIGARELVWHIHELYLELEGNVSQIIEYLEIDISRYQDPIDYIASYVFHRLPALQDNPEHVLTNNPFIVDTLLSINKEVDIDIDKQSSDTKKEYLAFIFFDNIVGPYLPVIDTKIAKQLVELRVKRNNELLLLRKYIRDTVTKLLGNANERPININDIEDCLYNLQNTVNDVLCINKQAWTRYFQSLLESKPIWLGIASLITSIASGHFPLISASLGAEILAAMGTNAAKTIKQRGESLKANPTRFIYYLDRKLRK